jgi:hypothetical protein
MDMAGKTVLVTSTDDAGRYVAVKLASAGAKASSHLYEHHDGA